MKDNIKLRKAMQLLLVACVLAVLVWFGFTVRSRGVESLLPSSLPLAALVILLLYAVKSVAFMIPFAALFFAAGMLFPAWQAMLLTYAGMLLNLTIGYFIGKKVGGKRAEEILVSNGRAAAVLARLGENQSTACFLARLLPLPFEPLTVFFAASGMSYGRHLIFTLLGTIPNVVPYVIAGRAIDNPLSAAFLVPFGVCIAFSIVTFFVMRRLEIKAGAADLENTA